MPLALLVAATLIVSAPLDTRPAGDCEDLRREAERLYDEGSYALALETYDRAAGLEVAPDDARWVTFRRADCAWRARSAAPGADPSGNDVARKTLETLAEEDAPPERRDRVWAEAQESLGDFWRAQGASWSSTWPRFEHALDWWARSTDLETAGRRYLSIVRRLARPERDPIFHHVGGSLVPVPVLENALRIAGDADRPWLHLEIAQALQALQAKAPSGPRQARIARAFVLARAPGKASPFYDDALHYAARWLEQESSPEAQGIVRPDRPGAVALYRRLLDEFVEGESRFRDRARARIESLTTPRLGVRATHVFAPGTEVVLAVSWRNLGSAELELYPVDLVDDFDPAHHDEARRRRSGWAEHFDLAGREPWKRWTIALEDDGQHGDHRRLEPIGTLDPGAWLLLAKGADSVHRELILVSDLLNEFGSAWAEVPLTGAMPLGAYTIGLAESDDPEAPDLGLHYYVFSLEEYELPEFKVTVSTPREGDGRRPVVRPGDVVTAEITAEYYSGGPVPDAAVEVVVARRPSPTGCARSANSHGATTTRHRTGTAGAIRSTGRRS